jgi:transposase
MKRFIEGEDRLQGSLLPECLDDCIGQDNPVRVVDAFVEELDLQALGFTGVEPAQTGRPSYRPAVLLKIYIYGYLNRIQSSRRLERECQRNIELMWLTGRLAPDFKTIADFRRDSGKGIRNACRQFVTICRRLKLLASASVAVDASKFKAVNNRDRNFTPHKLAQRERQVEESIERYLGAMDTADLTQPADLELKTARLQDKLSSLRQQMKQLRRIGTQLRAAGRATVTDRPGRVFYGHQRARHRNGGLQRAAGGRHQAPLGRRPGHHQRRQRSISALVDGQPGS